MRKVLLVGVLAAAAPGGCGGHRAPSQAPAATVATVAAPAPAAQAPEPADPFRAEVAPVLAQRCAPCHNPGGKMYATLPFDDPATVASHPEGILKRIKDPAEHALIERWIASRPKS